MAERRRPVQWSLAAIADLDAIWDHYAGVAGPNTADKLLREIGTRIVLIEEHPLAGRSRAEVRPDLRSIATAPHVIFYRIKNGRAEIVRILDGRQDIDEIFAEHG